MKEEGITPSRETFVAVLRVHAKDGDIATMLSEIEHLKSEGIHLQDKDILQLIYDLAVNGHGASCTQLFELLTKGGFYPRLAANTAIRLMRNNLDVVANSLLQTIPGRTAGTGENLNSNEFLINRLSKGTTEIVQKPQGDGSQSVPSEVISPKPMGIHSTPRMVLRDRKAKEIPAVEDNFQSWFDSANETDVVKMLRSMIHDFGIYPTTRFLNATVLPKLNVKKPDAAINLLLSADVLPKRAGYSVCFRCLQQNQLKNAADVMNEFGLHVQMDIYQPLLNSALKATDDVKSYVHFLRVYYENFRDVIDESGNTEVDSNASNAGRADALGSIIYDTVAKLHPKQRAKTLTAILQGLVNQGITISSAQSDRIERNFRTDITINSSKCLDKLVWGELELKPLEKSCLQIRKIHPEVFQLEQKIMENTKNTIARQIELLKSYLQKGEIVKFEHLLKELEGEKVSISPKIYDRLLRSKLAARNLTETVKIFDKCRAKNEEFFLRHDTFIQAVTLFIDNGRFSEALQFIARNKRTIEVRNPTKIQPYSSLLDRLAEEGRETEVNQLLDSFLKNGHLLVHDKLLWPLVRVHLVNGNTMKAVETFKLLVKKYKRTPHKEELWTHLIVAEDWTTLEEVAAICFKIHGKHSVLFDLALVLVECGQFKRARDTFDSLNNSFISEDKIKSIVRNSRICSSIECLEHLIKATRNLKGATRGPIFLSLLKLYIQEDQREKALDLWVQLQELEEVPSQDFLIKLGTYLRSKNVDVPFEVPNPIKKNTIKATQKVQRSTAEQPAIGKEFIEQLQKGNLAEIRKAYHELPEPNLNAVINTIFHEVGFSRLIDALDIEGEVEALEKINSLLPEEKQSGIWYTNSYAQACSNSGQSQRWINEWNSKLVRAHSDEELQQLSNCFPGYGFSYLFQQNPELLRECKFFFLSLSAYK